MSGLNDKLGLLLETILSHIKNFEVNFTEDVFNAVREQIKKEYYNNFIKPDKLVREIRLSLMQEIYR